MIRIQQKVWMLAAVVLVSMIVIWTSLTYFNQETQTQYNNILQRYLRMNEAMTASQQLVTDTNNYLLNPEQRQYEQVHLAKETLRQAKYAIYDLRNMENDFELTNFIHLIDSLSEASEGAIQFKQANETEASVRAFSEATRISAYISEMTLTLLNKELKTYGKFYRGIIAQSEALRELGIWLLLLISFVLLVMSYRFSMSITRPVMQLSQAAKELSKGRFDLQIDVKSNDEIAFLARMFERMRVNINNYISEIQQKAQLENELQQNKLMLQQSQLHSLQSQINPHFLFNTLDMLSKKAFIEGAEETSDLLVNVAGLLRYNLRRLDRSITLGEEVRVLKQYIEIQQARFAEQLTVILAIDEQCLDLHIPALTLQPIIENAVIHSVETDENGGTIRFSIRGEADQVIVEIEDNGPGIPEEKIRGILEGRSAETEGHTTGIGLYNVAKRLSLFFGRDDVLAIHSTIDHGTTVILRIPKQRSVPVHDENTDRR